MQLGLLFRGRLTSRIYDGEIEMRVGVIRIGRDRVEHLFLGRLRPAFLARGDAEIIVRCRTLGIDPQRRRELRNRFVEFALAIKNDAERGVREFILRRERDRLLQRQLGRFPFAGAEINDAEIAERIQIVRRFGQDLLISLFRGAIFSLLEIVLGVSRQRRELVGNSGRGRLDGGPGRFVRSVFRHRERALRRRRVHVGDSDDRLSQQRQFGLGQFRYGLRQQLDLPIQRVGFDLKFVELGQHQFLGLFAPRFLLALAEHDLAKHVVLLHQPRRFFRVRASQLRLLQFAARFLQLRAQIRDRDFKFFVLFLAGRQLLAQLLDLPFYLRDFLFLLRFVGADLAHGLFRERELRLQIGVLGHEHLDSFLRLLRGLQFREQLIALLRYRGDLRALDLLLLLGGHATFFRRGQRLLQLCNLAAQRFLLL